MIGPKPSTVSNSVVLYSSNPRFGLGDAIAAVTNSVGISPCGPCKKRQASLNQWWFELVDKLAETFKSDKPNG